MTRHLPSRAVILFSRKRYIPVATWSYTVLQKQHNSERHPSLHRVPARRIAFEIMRHEVPDRFPDLLADLPEERVVSRRHRVSPLPKLGSRGVGVIELDTLARRRQDFRLHGDRGHTQLPVRTVQAHLVEHVASAGLPERDERGRDVVDGGRAVLGRDHESGRRDEDHVVPSDLRCRVGRDPALDGKQLHVDVGNPTRDMARNDDRHAVLVWSDDGLGAIRHPCDLGGKFGQ